MYGPSEEDAQRNEKFNRALTKFTDNLDDQSWLRKILSIILLANVLTWIFALLVPQAIVYLWTAVGNKLVSILFSLPLYLGFGLAYVLFRIRFPDIEENKELESDLMASVKYNSASNRRYFVWLASILAGILNTALWVLASFVIMQNELNLFTF